MCALPNGAFAEQGCSLARGGSNATYATRTVLPAFRPLVAVGVDVAELLPPLPLPPTPLLPTPPPPFSRDTPPSLVDLLRRLGDRTLSPPPDLASRPPKKPPSLPNPPLLGDLDLGLTSTVRGDLRGPGSSKGARGLAPALGEPGPLPPHALRGAVAGVRAGTVAPRDFAALEVLTRADGPAAGAGGTTAILPDAGERATAAAAVAAAEAGTAVHLRGIDTADAAAPTAAAATAAATSWSSG